MNLWNYLTNLTILTSRFSVFVHPVMKEKFRSENSDSEDKLKLLEWVTQPATEQLDAAPSQRFIKTHLPMSLLPPELLDTAKIVYVARDPRDVVVSFYHMNRLIRTQGYIGDFKTYWNYFMRDLRKLLHWNRFVWLFNFRSTYFIDMVSNVWNGFRSLDTVLRPLERSMGKEESFKYAVFVLRRIVQGKYYIIYLCIL